MKSFLRACVLAFPFPIACTASLTLTLNPINEICSYANGRIDVTVSGGLPPYTFLWSDLSTEGMRTNLSAGTYSVTVTDATSAQVTDQATILSVPYTIQVCCSLPYCGSPGELLFTDTLPQASWPGPWYVDGAQIDLAPGSMANPPVYAFFPYGPGPFSYSIMDGNGCSGTVSGETGTQITDWPAFSVASIEPSCSNIGTGAIHLLSTGPTPDLTWGFLNLLNADTTYAGQGAVPDQNLEATFSNLLPGTYGIHWWLGVTAEALDPGTCMHDTVWVTVPSIGPVCGQVQGNSWFDVDQDCVRDAGEVGIPLSTLDIEPGGIVAITNIDGSFNMPLLNGSYTLAQTDPTLVPICPVVQPVPFTVNTDVTTIDLANGSTQPLDLRVYAAAGTAVPGFSLGIWAEVRNLSPQASGPVTLNISFDPALVLGTIAPTPSSVVGNSITWDLAAFGSYEHQAVSVGTTVPVGTPLGTVLITTVQVSNTLPESDPANNTSTLNTTVVGSFDPNNKTVRTSSGSSDTQYFIDQDNHLDYTIRFQNTGTATAATVVVTDTLSADLDMLSFEQGVASHPFEVSFKLGRVVEWRFDNIQLPDSATNEPLSHGLVGFRIKPVEPLLPGTEISNTANIYFDLNEPVITEPSVLTAEFSTGIEGGSASDGLRLLPNPATELITLLRSNGATAAMDVRALDGRTVLTGSCSSPRCTLDVRALPCGVYTVTVHETGGPVTRRFVKQ